jgi:ribonuclease D
MTELGKVDWIDKPEDVGPLCDRVAATNRVAFDTEADSFHSYFHKLCLIQLSFDGVHALIDPLRLGRDDLKPLVAILEDPAIEVLVHGADYDMRVLDRDLGAHPLGLRDTEMAARLLGEPKTGLATQLSQELDVTVNKQFQRADWGRRPLSNEMQRYAIGDTSHLAGLADRLESRLAELGRTEWWLEECAAIEQIRYEPPERGPLAFERVKEAKKSKGSARDRLAALFQWREDAAARADRPPFYILAPKTMIQLAETPPTDSRQLRDMPGLPPAFARRNGDTIVALLAAPPPAPPRSHKKREEHDSDRQDRIKKLRDAVIGVAKKLALDPSILAPKTCLADVARLSPGDENALGETLGRRWRATVLADRLLPIVRSW